MSLPHTAYMGNKGEGESMEEDVGAKYSDEDSDSDDDDNAHEEQLHAKIRQLKKELDKNINYYDGYISLIDTYKELGDLEELRKIRQKMSEVYPLTPELWLSWLKDEQSIATSKEERTHIVTLFKRAVKDYMSVSLWVEYIMFMLGGGDKDATRAVCEAALTAVGTHVGEGLLIWQAVLLTEQQVYSSMTSSTSSEDTGEEIKKQEKQFKKIQSFYKRQVRVPLLNVDGPSLIEEMSPWFKGSLEPQIEVDLDKAMAKLKDKMPFEDELLSCSADSTENLDVYNRYLTFIKETDNPSSVINLYERAITDNALNCRLWEDYIHFLLKQFPTADYLILPACKRSLRNCPWSGPLIEMYINTLQKFNEDEEDKQILAKKINGVVEASFTKCIPMCLDAVKIWMSYLVYLRRNLDWQVQDQDKIEKFRNACFKAIDMIDKTYGEEGDIESEIPRFLARIEAEFVKNMESARTVWNTIILQRNENYKNATLWMEYINLERCYGTEKHCRKLFRRALERVKDWVEVIGSAFQRFEQECGNLETYEDFQKRYKNRLAVIMKVREETIAKEEVDYKQKNVKRDKRKQQQPQKKKNQNKTEEFKAPYPIDSSKRGYEQKDGRSSGTSSNYSPSSSISKTVSETPGYSEKALIDSKSSMPPPDNPRKSATPPPGYPGKVISTSPPPENFGKNVPPPPGFPGKASTPPPSLGHPGSTVEPPPGFIYHNPHSPSRGSQSPSRSPNPQSPSRSSNPELPSRSSNPELPSRSSNPELPIKSSKRPAENDSAGNDNKRIKVDDEQASRTVFLKNLTFTATDEEICKVFDDCGEIESLQRVKNFKGLNKGFAYLIFKNIHSAQKALTKDRHPIQGRPLFASAYEPENQQHYFKFKTGEIEKDKLFIRGLPYSMKEDDVKKVFLQHGPIKDIRLVIYRNGYSKGTCYIDYHDEETAAKVKSVMDGAELEDKVISVMFSCPPSKSTPNPYVAAQTRPPPMRGSQGPRLNLLPRALQRNTVSKSKSGPDLGNGSNNGSENLEKPKSNEDFRKMLLKN